MYAEDSVGMWFLIRAGEICADCVLYNICVEVTEEKYMFYHFLYSQYFNCLTFKTKAESFCWEKGHA